MRSTPLGRESPSLMAMNTHKRDALGQSLEDPRQSGPGGQNRGSAEALVSPPRIFPLNCWGDCLEILVAGNFEVMRCR